MASASFKWLLHALKMVEILIVLRSRQNAAKVGLISLDLIYSLASLCALMFMKPNYADDDLRQMTCSLGWKICIGVCGLNDGNWKFQTFSAGASPYLRSLRTVT